MSESIHDIALKLGLLNDAASFAAGEQLVDNFTKSTIRNNERIKASNAELQRSRAQDRLDNETEKVRLKHRSPTQVADESMERLDNLFMATSMSAKVYEKELENIYNTWNDITRAQAANTVILQAQQNVQSLAVERAEDEIVRQQQLLELKQDIINRTLRLQEINNATSAGGLRQTKEITDATTATQYLITAEERRDNAIRTLQQDVALANRTNAEYARGLTAINAQYERERDLRPSDIRQQQASKRISEEEGAKQRTEHTLDVETRRRKEITLFSQDMMKAGRTQEEYTRGLNAINAQYDREAAALKTANPLRKQAEGLLNQYRDTVDRTTEDIAILNARLADGTITLEEHSRAVVVANQRLSQMRHGAGNTIYAIGELGRGLEDFITVMSITGMNAQGFGMAMRGASNNISQAASLMSGASGAMIGSFAGIAALAVGQLVTYLFKATSQADLLTISLEKNKAAIDAMSNTRTKALDQKNTMFDINDIKTAEEARGKVTKDLPREIEKQKEELKKIQQEIIVNEQKNMATLFGGPEILAGLRNNINDLRKISIITSGDRGRADEAAKAIEAAVVKTNEGIRTSNEALIQSAIEDFEEIGTQYKDLIEELVQFSLLGPGGTAIKTSQMLLGDNYIPYLEEQNIHDVLSKQLKDKEKMAAMDATNLKLREDVKAAEQAILDFEAQRIKNAETLLQHEEEEFNIKQKIQDNMLENMKIETDRAAKQESLVNRFGKKDEQGFLQDYSIMYSNLMNTKGIEQPMTRDIFNNLNSQFDEQLNTRYAALNNQLNLSTEQQPNVTVDTSTALKALGDANEQIMKAMGPDKNQAIIDELKAIQEAFSRNMFPVERLN